MDKLRAAMAWRHAGGRKALSRVGLPVTAVTSACMLFIVHATHWGSSSLTYAGGALIGLAGVLGIAECLLGHRREMAELRRGSARDKVPASLATAVIRGDITSQDAVKLLDSQSIHEIITAGLASDHDADNLAQLIRAVHKPETEHKLDAEHTTEQGEAVRVLKPPDERATG
jgi:hypothetical protein